MSFMNNGTFCSECNLTFRSHRAFKNHQQRFHLIYSDNLSKYNYFSSNLVLAFSSKQFVYITTYACEQQRLPLGDLSSKLFSCSICSISFPSLFALNYHRIYRHEQYEYEICQDILHDIIIEIDNNRTNELNSMRTMLAKQATLFGLKDKILVNRLKTIRNDNYQRIFPSCQHQNRTCANLCVNYLTSYYQFIENYPFKISFMSKGTPFVQGSIVSDPSIQMFNSTKDNVNIQVKRIRSSPQIKRKFNEQQIQSNESMSPKKLSSNKTNLNYTRSLSSISSTSSTSTRSLSKISRQLSTTSFKRSLSPTISLAVERSSEKRRRQRKQRQTKMISSKIADDIEQENDDDDIHLIQTKKPKQRQASNSSVEYVQIIDTEQPTISSLNNIENFKLKSPIKTDDEIIICHTSSPKKKTNSTSDHDEHVRVRCKICGEIIEGRSQFSQHVLSLHSHLLKSNSTRTEPTTTASNKHSSMFNMNTNILISN